MTPAAALAPVTPVLAHLAAPCVGQAVKGFLLLRIQAGVKAARRLVTSFGVFWWLVRIWAFQSKRSKVFMSFGCLAGATRGGGCMAAT